MLSPSRAGPEPPGGSAQWLWLCSRRRRRRLLAPGPQVPGSSFYPPFPPRIFFKGDPSWGGGLVSEWTSPGPPACWGPETAQEAVDYLPWVL